jgi:hypothetical protein
MTDQKPEQLTVERIDYWERIFKSNTNCKEWREIKLIFEAAKAHLQAAK